MKKNTLLGCVTAYLFLGITSLYAQDSTKVISKMKTRTLLTQFESDFVLTVSERIALKQSRIAYQYRTREILNTLNLSDRKRNKLIEELKRNPFSNRIQAILAQEAKSKENQKEIRPN